MKNEDIKLLDETERIVRKQVAKIGVCDEIASVLLQIRKYVTYLDEVQQMPQLSRERYYVIAHAVFNYLRVNRQLGREAREIDRNVILALFKIFREIEYDYGIRKN